MSIVCDSPKFEVTNDQTSYFNIHMPGSFMATPVNDNTSPGYFDINPKSSPVQTPYFDTPQTQSPAQTPFFDCETLPTPFFEQPQLIQQHLRNNINNPPQPNLQLHNNNIDNYNYNNGNTNNNNNISKDDITFKDGLVTPAWVKSGTFAPKLPLRRQTLNPKSSTSKKPYSMPASLSPFTPVSNPIEEFSIDNVADLIKKQSPTSVELESSRHIILLLDLRPFSMYSTERIKSSVNICVPSTLLKRGSFSTDKITETLTNDADKSAFRDWSKYENIVLYDNDSNCPSETSPISHLYKKFNLPNCKPKIGLLKGNYLYSFIS